MKGHPIIAGVLAFVAVGFIHTAIDKTRGAGIVGQLQPDPGAIDGIDYALFAANIAAAIFAYRHYK